MSEKYQLQGTRRRRRRGGGGGVIMIAEEMEMEMELKSSSSTTTAEEEEEVELPGFRFHPTDEELVGFYLRRKVDRKRFSIEIIKEIDIYKHDPWDLPKGVSASGEKEWYFFCLRGRKYRNSIRPNRVTGSGFWKATGIDRPVYSSGGGDECIGLKKSLVYYRGSAGKGAKTDWMMHEFRLPGCSATAPSPQEAEVWTICRIFKRAVSCRKIIWRGAAAAAEAEAAEDKTETPADSGGSKSCSFDSDSAGNDCKLLVSPPSYPASQWSATAAQQDPMTAAMAAEDLFRLDNSWDELGRIVEFMKMDQSVASSYCEYQ